MNITTILETFFDSGKRILKVLRLGKNDVQTSFESSPFGFDSNPVKEMKAIYSKTESSGQSVIIGYINKSQIAEVGESRIFSTDTDGNLVFSLHLKNDGTAEFGGNSDNLIRYLQLNNALSLEVQKINVELVKIATGLNAIVPGSYVHTPVTVDISAAKIDEIKTS